MDLTEIQALIDADLMEQGIGVSAATVPTPTPTALPTVDYSLGRAAGQAWEGIKSVPSGLASLASSAENVLPFLPGTFNPVTAAQKLSRVDVDTALPAGMKVGGGIAGALAGAKTLGAAGSIGGPALGLAGAVLGGAAGFAGGSGLTQALLEGYGLTEPTTGQEKFDQFFRETGAGLVGEAVPLGVAKVVGRTAKGLTANRVLQAETTGLAEPAAAQAVVGDTLKSLGVTEKDLVKALSQTKQSPAGATMSTAEALVAAENPKGAAIAQLEQDIAGQPNFSMKYAERAAAYPEDLKTLIKGIAPDAENFDSALTSRVQTGEVALEELATKYRQDMDQISERYSVAMDKGDTIKRWGNTKTVISNAFEEYFSISAKKNPPTELSKLRNELNEYLQPQNKVTLKGLQQHYSDLGEKSIKFFKEGDIRAAKVASIMQDQVENLIMNAPKGAKKWKEAVTFAAPLYKQYRNGPLKKLIDDPNLLPEVGLGRITRNASTVNKYIDAVGINSPGHQALKQQVLVDLYKQLEASPGKAMNAVSGVREDVLKAILRDDYDYVRSLVTDYRARTKTKSLANPTLGSPTAQKLNSVLATALGKQVPETVAEAAINEARRKGRNILAGVSTAGMMTAGVPWFPAVVLGGATRLAGLGKAAYRAVQMERAANTLGKETFDALMNPQRALAAIKASNQAAITKQTRSAADEAFLANIRAAGQKGQLPTGIAAATQAGPSMEIAESEGVEVSLSGQELLDRAFQQLERLGGGALLSPEEASANAIPDYEETVPETIASTDPVEKVKEWSRQFDPLTQAQMEVESNFRPKARSRAGAIGLMQLMPRTAKELKVNPNDPQENVEGGQRYREKMIKRFGSKELGLAAYNWGPGSVSNALKKLVGEGYEPTFDNLLKYGSVPTETKNYVKKVLSLEAKYSV